LRGPAEVIGILEAFSSDAKTFADGQITFLEKLGEIAEAAYRRQSNQVNLMPVAPDLLLAVSELPIASVARDREISLATLEEPAPKVRSHYWILAGALAMMLLASAVVWWKWRGMAAENTPSQPTTLAQTAPGATAGDAAPRVFPLKPSASIADQQADRSRGKGLLQNAAKVEEERNADVTRPGNNVAARNITPVISAGSVSGPGASRATVEPPVVVLATANNGDGLAGIASAPDRLPELDVKVSQGVTAGSIIRKVEPVYPRDALTKRLGGPVKLEASVAEDGIVSEVKVLQGEPMLAAAAVAAVRQWRYSPSLLNGKPIPVLKDITVIFKAP
jgi:TonB family protein